jgi:hypothetical protein
MHVARSILLLMTGAASGIAFVLSCGDNLSVQANADAAIDAPKVPDAAPTCDCPAAEPPLAGRFVVVSQTLTIAANDFGGQAALCPVGSQLLSGSCTQDLLNPYRNLTLQQSGFFDIAPGGSWFCWFRNNEPFPVTIRVSVTCLKQAP